MHRPEDGIDGEVEQKLYLVVLHDRHTDDQHHICDSLAKANEFVQKFIDSYANIHDADVTWREQNYGRNIGWIRYVDCYDDGPHARIELKELNK